MNQRKLQALRERYLDAEGADIDDPNFTKAARQQFSDDDRRNRPFADPATFLGASERADAAATDFRDIDIALVGGDGPRRHQPGGRPAGPTRGAGRSSASAPTSTSCA